MIRTGNTARLLNANSNKNRDGTQCVAAKRKNNKPNVLVLFYMWCFYGTRDSRKGDGGQEMATKAVLL